VPAGPGGDGTGGPGPVVAVTVGTAAGPVVGGAIVVSVVVVVVSPGGAVNVVGNNAPVLLDGVASSTPA
jgi:hypothetical protein